MERHIRFNKYLGSMEKDLPRLLDNWIDTVPSLREGTLKGTAGWEQRE